MSINKDELIRRVASSDDIKEMKVFGRVTMSLIRSIYDELENQIVAYLSELDECNTVDNPKVVRVFEGITLSSYYKPQKETVLNFSETKEKVTVKSRIDVKANVTRYIREKITRLNKELRG